jgi:ornithine racemase
MKNPKLIIDLNKLQHNANTIINMCSSHGINVVGVTKCICAEPIIVKILQDSGIQKLADSRLQNIIKLRQAGFQGEVALLRIPMKSEALEAVQYADSSYHSEIDVIAEFNKAATKLKKVHKVILMIEVGDLREGIPPKDLDNIVEEVLSFSTIKLQGLAMNVGCYGGVLPSYQNTSLLVNLRKHIETKYRIALPVISGGSTSSLYLLKDGSLPTEINELRVGEAFFLGIYSSYDIPILGTYQDAFKLEAEIIEIREKPSLPTGETNKDAFGETPKMIDKGMRRRAICALGRQDVYIKGIFPCMPGVEIIGASSDHLIVEITEVKRTLQVGDVLSFSTNYGGLLSLMTSPYVMKQFKYKTRK